MRWIDGSDIDIGTMTGEDLCGRLTDDMWEHDRSVWLGYDEPIRTAAFIIDFDTELQMEGIFSFTESETGRYASEIIKAFRCIGDDRDADILSEICRLAPPDGMRGELSEKDKALYELSSFNEDHALHEEISERISELAQELYLNRDFDGMWQKLFSYLDESIQTK